MGLYSLYDNLIGEFGASFSGSASFIFDLFGHLHFQSTRIDVHLQSCGDFCACVKGSKVRSKRSSPKASAACCTARRPQPEVV